MPLNYDPRHVARWIPRAGVYSFRINTCEETVFSTGSIGLRVQLAVDVERRGALRIWDNIVFGERTTWKMFELCQATGVRFDPPCEAGDLVGKTGRARFELEEFEGLIRLRVAHYLPRVT
jgi:hypothetical protein